MFLTRLYSLCALRNTTISAAVKAAGGNTGSIDGWKKKGSLPRAEMISALADYLETSADYLLGRTDNPDPIAPNMRQLTAEEMHLFDQLQRAEPSVRAAVFRMAEAALGVPPAREAENRGASFLSPHDEKYRP